MGHGKGVMVPKFLERFKIKNQIRMAKYWSSIWF